jgi:hypothetical protein
LADDHPQVWDPPTQDTVAEALEIDKATDTGFWRKAVNKKEMAKVKTNKGLSNTAASSRRQSTGTD